MTRVRATFGSTRLALLGLAIAVVHLGAGCRQDMHNQPKYKPLRESRFFPDQRQARPIVPGTVARGHLEDDGPLYTGKGPEGFVASLPVPVNGPLLERGRERYGIYCTPCHDRTGSGDGMIVRRGYPKPPSFHEQRLREAAAGYFFHTITNGFGVMPSYALQVPVADRWAIVAYIRALQFSQYVPARDLTADERAALDAPPAAPASVAGHEMHGHEQMREHP